MLVKRDYEALLPQLMRALFPSASDRAIAQEMLGEFKHNEQARVRVGILRVSNGELEKMKAFIGLANCDWRDLLVEAEFNRSFGEDRLRKSDPKKYRKLEECEAGEYDEWIKIPWHLTRTCSWMPAKTVPQKRGIMWQVNTGRCLLLAVTGPGPGFEYTCN